ncbi:DUF6538 domain-containing protein [Burkholderia sp. THE68]
MATFGNVPAPGPYWFKRKVPKGLVPFVGKTWVQFTLGTRDFKPQRG